MHWDELAARLAQYRGSKGKKLLALREATVVRREWSVESLYPEAFGPDAPKGEGARALAKPPASGRYNVYGLDDDGRLVRWTYFNPDQICTQQAIFEHRPDGALVIVTDPDGAARTITWLENDASGRCVRSLWLNIDDVRREKRFLWKGSVLVGSEKVDHAAAFDGPGFAKALARAVLAGWNRRPASAKRETPYAVALFTNAETHIADVSLCLNTDEALARAGGDAALRWSTPDWSYFDIAPALGKLGYPARPDASTDRVVHDAMVAALRALRPLVGDEVTLLVVCGDMSPAFFERGLVALNPERLVTQARRFPLP